MGIVSSFCTNCLRTVYLGESDTLTCPVCASPLVAAQPEDTERVARIAQNEGLFRELNENIEETIKKDGASPTQTTSYVCECGDKNCKETLHLSPNQYEAVRKEPSQFVVLKGHVAPEAERIVQDHGSYLVVEKIGTGRVIAEETDPRS